MIHALVTIGLAAIGLFVVVLLGCILFAILREIPKAFTIFVELGSMFAALFRAFKRSNS